MPNDRLNAHAKWSTSGAVPGAAPAAAADACPGSRVDSAGGCVRAPVCYPDPLEQRPRSGREGEFVMTWWPGWNSIEGAAKWGDIFFWAGFALLVLLAGCEILSKVYGWREDT